MTKREIARWLTPGLERMRLTFTTFGGSAHGKMSVECENEESGDWEQVHDLGRANGSVWTTEEKVNDATINQFTGEVNE